MFDDYDGYDNDEQPDLEPDLIDEFLEKNPKGKVLWISGDELRQEVEKNPNWVEENARADRPVGVTTFADLEASDIRRLSPFIVFRGVELEDSRYRFHCAKFAHCVFLENAAGQFHGYASFKRTGIKEIHPDLVVHKVSDKQEQTNFLNCTHLKVARGTFSCGVNFEGSAIEEIDTDPTTGLRVTGCSPSGMAASFAHCDKLQVLKGKYPGSVSAGNSSIRQVAYDKSDPHDPEKNLIITGNDEEGTALYLAECPNLETVSLRVPGRVFLNRAAIRRIDRIEETPTESVPTPLVFIEVQGCHNLERIPPEYCHAPKRAQKVAVQLDQKQYDRITQTYAREKRARQMLKNPLKDQEPGML